MSRIPAPASAPPDLPGYRFIRHLGAGGNAQVYLYEQDLPRREVAVKVLNESALSEAARRRFTAEANVTAGLPHRHIVQVFDAKVTDDGRPYIVMPYYPQPNLSVRARRSHFSVAEVLRVGIQIGSAVETSHRHDVLHRDIKPQNVLTDSYGEPALTDFGIATTKGGDGPEGMSVPWSPPEILYGTAPGDQRSDVYSLGATLWHLLAGAALARRGRADRVLRGPRRVRLGLAEVAAAHLLTAQPARRAASCRRSRVGRAARRDRGPGAVPAQRDWPAGGGHGRHGARAHRQPGPRRPRPAGRAEPGGPGGRRLLRVARAAGRAPPGRLHGVHRGARRPHRRRWR